MKDEEMAAEFAEEHAFRVPYDGSNKFYDDVDYKASKEGFLAGLKAGRPQWHDLRKDPNDLPKNDSYVLIATQKRVYLGFYDCCWFSHEIDDIGDVIAWCEIPTFDKE